MPPSPAPSSVPPVAAPAQPTLEQPGEGPAEETEGSAAQTHTSEPAKPSGAALRNENVFASKLDTDTQKADNIRMGVEYVLVPQPKVESGNYAAEYGRTSAELVLLGRPVNLGAWHGEINESLQNSVFNARTFFQVGAVAPSGLNNYGGRFSGDLGRWGILSGSFANFRNRGMVNGNVLVPLPSERTPLSPDPANRAIVQRFLNAYPNMAPNRTDFDPRALNTNAPERVRTLDGSLRLDKLVRSTHQISAFHSISRQTINAFQLVAGSNPDTTIRSHRSQLTWRHSGREGAEYSAGANYLRNRANLYPEPNAVGPRVRTQRAIAELGPEDQYPLDRIENTFRYGALAYRRVGQSHRLTFGGDFTRYQMNGYEQNYQRGNFTFGPNFGRSAIENLLLGLPTNYSVQFGEMNRGFRTWSTDVFLADEWRVRSNLQLYIGLRHTINSAPSEVNGRSVLPYGDDRNNFAPRFAFAYRSRLGWIARGSYSIAFGQILPVTYSQERYNPPSGIRIEVNNPDLVNPLRGVDLSAAGGRSSVTAFSPDLASPYTHQYNFSLQHSFGDYLNVEVGYLGSRTIKPINFFHLNRAVPVPGIPFTTATVNERRPDPRYYDYILITNSGNAYLDAGRLTWSIPSRRGLSFGGSYTFSKALDTGASYTSTAANRDLSQRSQWQYENHKDRKSFSDFDAPHAFTVYSNYRWPQIRNRGNALGWITNGWDVSGVLLFKSGTPFNVSAGSDAPGFGNVDGTGQDRPNLLNLAILHQTIGNPDTSADILRREYFSYMTPGEVRGNIENNAFRKHGIRNLNGAVTREWHWGKQRTYLVRFRGEAFNLGNHPQFDAPNYVLATPSFGRITNTLNNGRVLQFGLRLSL